MNKINTWLEKQEYFNSNLDTQIIKLMEEVGELASGRITGNPDEIKDAVGDIMVVLTTISHFSGFTITEALAHAYNDIKDREYEKLPNGGWKRLK